LGWMGGALPLRASRPRPPLIDRPNPRPGFVVGVRARGPCPAFVCASIFSAGKACPGNRGPPPAWLECRFAPSWLGGALPVSQGPFAPLANVPGAQGPLALMKVGAADPPPVPKVAGEELVWPGSFAKPSFDLHCCFFRAPWNQGAGQDLLFARFRPAHAGGLPSLGFSRFHGFQRGQARVSSSRAPSIPPPSGLPALEKPQGWPPTGRPFNDRTKQVPVFRGASPVVKAPATGALEVRL